MTQKEFAMWAEGLKLKPYSDTKGKLTIGVGHNIDAKPLQGEIGAYFKKNGCITRAMAEILLEIDLAAARLALLKALPWVAKLSQVRQMVLIDMCFNMGIGWYDAKTGKGKGLLSFHNTLKLIEDGHYDQAAAAMEESKWYREVKRRAMPLVSMMRDDKIPELTGL